MSIEQGLRCLQGNKLQDALQVFNKLIILTPGNADLYLARAKTYMKLGDFTGAISNYRKAIRLTNELPADACDRFAALLDAEGFRYLTSKKYSHALSYFTEAISLNGLRPNFWRHRILAYIGLDRSAKALKDVDHCMALEGKTASMLLIRAKLNWKLGLKDRGNQDIGVAYKLDPTNQEVVSYEQNLLNKSQEVYENAWECLMKRDYTKALTFITAAMQLNPEDVKILVMRASCLREMGDLQSATHDITTAAYHYSKLNNQGQQEHPEITRQRNLIRNDEAVLNMGNGNYSKALDLLNQAIESEVATCSRWNAIDARYYVNRGDCYRELEKLHAALSDYNRALDLLPSPEIKTRLSLVYHQFGIDLFNDGKFDAAELEFTKAIQFNSQIPAYYVHRAEAAQFQDKTARAFLDYTAAAKLDPYDISIQERLVQYQRSQQATLPKAREKSKPRNAQLSLKEYQDPSLGLAEKANKKYRMKDKQVQLLRHRLQLDNPFPRAEK